MSYAEQSAQGGRNAAITNRRYPLQAVVSRQQWPNYMLDLLACGHEVVDYDSRVVKRRRCTACPRIDL